MISKYDLTNKYELGSSKKLRKKKGIGLLSRKSCVNKSRDESNRMSGRNSEIVGTYER
jgi:hypothetical protein